LPSARGPITVAQHLTEDRFSIMNDGFSDLLTSMQAAGDGTQRVSIPAGWAQGQSTYGGLTAALGLEAVCRTYEDLPPLRSAMVNFIGAAGGDLTVRPELIRQGRSMTVAQADVIAEKGLATRSTFSFGVGRESAFDETHLPVPDLPEPEDAKPYFSGNLRPNFTQFFDSRLAKGGMPRSGSDQTNHFIWVKFEEPIEPSMVSLLALADMPPPAMMPKFTEFKPISSLTWMVNVLQENPQPYKDGWWLLQSRAEHASQGYSSQDMLVWGADLQPVIAGRQLVAIYL
jgi:acyl-CoA thioesterase